MDDDSRANDSGNEEDLGLLPSPERVRDTETHQDISQIALEFHKRFNSQGSKSRNPTPEPLDSSIEVLHSSFELCQALDDNDSDEEDKTRVVKDVPVPIRQRLPEVVAIDQDSGEPRTVTIRMHFRDEGRLEESCALKILERAAEILEAEPTLLEVQSPITIVGDIHGQFYDLMRIFELCGPVNERNRYLFLGDYVDRGYFSTECLLYLMALKIKHPKEIFFLRGNHECEHTTKYFTYERECQVKYSQAVYEASIRVFKALPLAAVLDEIYFCVHGGLSPEIHSLQDIKNIDRFREVPTFGPMCDLLWSDPHENFGYEKTRDHFIHNSARGCSYYYTYEAVCSFLQKNYLLSMIRGHEALHAGYQLYKNTAQDFPAMVTVFSCPNYCDVYKNKGAVIVFDERKFHIKQFNETPHPYCLPDFVDVFTWSIPFVAESVTKILQAVLNLCSPEELENDQDQEDLGLTDEQRQLRREKIRNKIRAVGKVASNYNKLSKQNHASLRLAGLSPTRSRAGPILDKVETLGDEHELSFEDIKNLDSINEKMPAMKSSETVEGTSKKTV